MLEYLKSVFRMASQRHRPVDGRLTIAVDALEFRQLLSAVTVQLGATHDTTIYEQDIDTSNGAGQFVVAGGGARGLVKFDVGGSTVPEGSTIIDAVLTLNVGEASGDSAGVSVHRVTTAWGEAASDAPGNEHQGASAQPFDATWLYSFYDGEQWHSPGGDFSSASASTSVGGVGAYEWISGGLIDDVQSWVDDAATNFGWLLQLGGGGAKSFLSSDTPGGDLGPLLEITYEPPPGPPAIVEGRLWNDLNGDGRRSDPVLSSLNLTIVGGNTYFDAFGGGEYWFRSSSTNSWYFLTADGRLSQWSGAGRTLSGSVVTTLDNIYYQQPGLVVQQGGDSEPWLNGWTVELIGSLGQVLQTTQTGGRDFNLDGAIDPDSEGGWYKFEVSSDETYTVRQVLPAGWSESVRVEVETSTPVEQAVNALELSFRNSYYQDFGGLNEKWMYSQQSGWHYITPDGNLYRWNGKAITAESPLTGTLVASVGTAYYDDPAAMFSGQFSEGDPTDEPSLTRVDFGNRQAQTVKGRVWLDFFDNGFRDTIDLARGSTTSYPDEPLAAGEEWFYDHNNNDWYVISVDGEARYWGPNDSSGGGSQSTALQAVTEPWLNGRTIQLVDQDGSVVATTTSQSIDLNEDGQIQFATERGWYVFEGIPFGDYTVRMVAEQSWVQTAPVTGLQSLAISLNIELGLRSTGQDFKNWGGRNERWLIGHDNRWYYILNDGSLYQWQVGTRASNGGLKGTLVATLTPDYYSNLQLLSDPDDTRVSTHVDADGVSQDLLFGSHRLLSDLFAESGSGG